MDEQTMQQILQLVQAASQGNQQAVQLIQLIQQAAQQGDLQAAAIMLVIQKIMQPQRAAKGAKLNYLKRLNGVCPEGYKTEYHKMGGQLCLKCVKAQEGMKAKNAVEEFKNKRKAEKAKCGSKLKK